MSIQLPTPDDKIKSRKQFVHWNDELLDSEAQEAIKIIAEVQAKYALKQNTKENLEELRDEALHRLADINIIAELDPSPCLYGEPPILEIKGKIQVDDIHQYGFDHEQKAYEVNKALERGEEYLGEKESLKSRKEK